MKETPCSVRPRAQYPSPSGLLRRHSAAVQQAMVRLTRMTMRNMVGTCMDMVAQGSLGSPFRSADDYRPGLRKRHEKFVTEQSGDRPMADQRWACPARWPARADYAQYRSSQWP